MSLDELKSHLGINPETNEPYFPPLAAADPPQEEAERIIDKLTKVIFEKDEIIKRQEREIEDLLGQIKAFKPIVDAWSARQPAPHDDYYED